MPRKRRRGLGAVENILRMFPTNVRTFGIILIDNFKTASIVERFGKPVRVASSGIRFFIPIIECLKDVRPLWDDCTNKAGVFIELSEQLRDTGPRDCFTKDNVKLNVNCAYRWRITDPIRAVYEVDKLHISIREAVLGEVRAYVGQNDLNTVLAMRSQISEHVVSVVSETVRR